VTVWKLVCKDTIEEKIIELQNLKKKLSDIIRVADEEGSSLTQEDIAYLLS
jgi:SNF2 family DNA or RNA helicase